MNDTKKQEDFHNKIAFYYNTYVKKEIFDYYISVRVKQILKSIGSKNPKNLTMMDGACGTGELAFLLSKHFKKVVGMDLSENMINLCKSRYENIPNLEYKKQDILNLSSWKNKFDLICCTDLHHLCGKQNVKKFLETAKKALKKDGVLFITDTNMGNLIVSRVVNKINKKFHAGNEIYLTKKEIELLLNKTGYKITNSYYFGLCPSFSPKSLIPFFDSLGNLISKTPLEKVSVNFYIIANSR